VKRYNGYVPQLESKGGWRSLVRSNADATAAEKAEIAEVAGLDADQLREAWEYASGLTPDQSLIVIRHGWIAAEWDRFGHGPVNSCTKSLTGLALAKLFELSDGGQSARRIGYDDPVCDYLPPSWAEVDQRRRLVKVKYLPTMCSGLQAVDRPGGPAPLELPVVYEAGTVDQYNSGGLVLEGMVIECASGMEMNSFFDRYLRDPIGAESVRFGDVTSCAGGATMTTRDLARFGYLMLHEGSWDDGNGITQVVGRDCIERCTTWPPFLAEVLDGPPTPGPDSPRPTTRYQWFTPLDPPSHFLHTWHGWWVNWSADWPSWLGPMWPSVPRDAFSMHGYGKDMCLIVPSLDMIVARQSVKGQPERILNSHPEFYLELLSRIMNAVLDRPR
jgi:CubicO group peptidase (beta-lactamase class C family)